MAIDLRKRTKARRLYEYDGISQESIAEIIGCSRKSIETWMQAAVKKKDAWVKGKYSQELRDREQAAKVKAIEDAGFNKGMVIAELGIMAFSDIKNHLNVDKSGNVTAKSLNELGTASRSVRSIKQKKVTRKIKDSDDEIEEVTLDYVLHDKKGSLELIGRELGMFQTEAEVTVMPPVFGYYKQKLLEKRGRDE